jgi:hypothetical protein
MIKSLRIKVLLKALVLLIPASVAGCAFGVISATTTLQEPAFMTKILAGDVTTATRCVGDYWQQEAIKMGPSWNLSTWEVTTNSSRVTVIGNYGAGTPPIGLVIEFRDSPNGTLSSAHVHSIYPKDDPRYTVTTAALNACAKK